MWPCGAVLVLALGGCAKSATDDSSKEADAKDSSGGLLSRVLETSKPITVPDGTVLHVTLDETISSKSSQAGESFSASVSQPVLVDGKTVIPKGARAVGRVVNARESGRLKGVAQLAVTLTSIEVGGKSYDLETSTFSFSGKNHNKRNLAYIGGGAAGGALIGGLAGGGKGALIGSAIGAGAGTAGAAATGKKDIAIPAETPLSFRLMRPITFSVKG
jgi:hypothetical protein